MSRFMVALGTLIAVAAAVAGCASEKEPEPQWTEESAYAAAEETYENYFEGSRFDSTTADAIDYVTGDLYDVQKSSDERYANHAIEVRGETYIESFEAQSFRTVGTEAVVEAYACINQATFELNVDGQGWTHPDQPDVYPVTLSFASADDSLKISNLEIGEASLC